MEIDDKVEKHSSSGLEFQLHPLVLINISDHHTRVKVNLPAGSPSPRVLGCLLGSQSGRTVDMSNSFELATGEEPGSIDEAFLHRKMEQYKQTFPSLDVVGWYATGSTTEDADMATHRKIMEINESPVFLRLDPEASPASRDLPLWLYESELHVLDGEPTFIFAAAKYTLATSEAERIGVDQVANILPAGSGGEGSQLAAHLGSTASAVEMLIGRLRALHALLARMQSGEVPLDLDVLRQAAGLTARLPAIDAPGFNADYAAERSDALLAVLLAAVTKGTAQANSLVDKYSLAYERALGGKRGAKGGAAALAAGMMSPAMLL